MTLRDIPEVIGSLNDDGLIRSDDGGDMRWQMYAVGYDSTAGACRDRKLLAGYCAPIGIIGSGDIGGAGVCVQNSQVRCKTTTGRNIGKIKRLPRVCCAQHIVATLD